MKVGMICKHDLKLNPHLKEKFTLLEANCTRKVNTRGDKVYSKILVFPVDYEEIMDNTETISDDSGLIIVNEPFFINNEIRKKVQKWIEWANSVDENEYNLFA